MWSDFACYSCGNSTVSFLVTTGASSWFKGKVCNVKITCIQWLDSITVYFVNCKWVHVEVGVVPWCSTDFHCSHHGLCLYNFLSMWRVLEWGINTYLKRNQKKKIHVQFSVYEHDTTHKHHSVWNTCSRKNIYFRIFHSKLLDIHKHICQSTILYLSSFTFKLLFITPN